MLNWARNLLRVTGSLLFGLGLSAALFADDPKPVAPDGYKLVPIGGSDGKPAYIAVKDSSSVSNIPNQNEGKYDPEQADFSRTSPLANKGFIAGDYMTSHGSAIEQRSFATRPYLTSNPTSSFQNFGAKFPTQATTAYSRQADGADRSYGGLSADHSVDKSAVFAAHTSSYQGQTATLGGQRTDTYASSLPKTYQDPNMKILRHESGAPPSNGNTEIQDLPDRPLTIDEVRNLINHGTRPDTDSPPEPATKALNDPAYEPESVAPPAPDSPTPPRYHPSDDDKNDPVPSPGTMGLPPENSEPLPK